METSQMAHMQPLQYQIPWLPMEFQIKFKVLVLTFEALNNLVPVYLQICLLQCISKRALYSADNNLLIIPDPKDFQLFLTTARALVLNSARHLVEDIDGFRHSWHPPSSSISIYLPLPSTHRVTPQTVLHSFLSNCFNACL